jgi:hypothetical protein
MSLRPLKSHFQGLALAVVCCMAISEAASRQSRAIVP